MAIEKIVNVRVNETGMEETSKKAVQLENNLHDLEEQNKSLADSSRESGNAVLENGGAMGLLNDLTGGLAMTVKDAVEATDLFTKSNKASGIVTNIVAGATALMSGAMKLLGISVNTTSTSFKVLRGALIATGVGALVVGIGLLIANFEKVKEVVFKFIPGLSAIGDLVGGLVEKFTDLTGITSKAGREFDKMNENAEKSLAKNANFMANYGHKLDEFSKQRIEAVNRYHQRVKEINESEMSDGEKLHQAKLARARMEDEVRASVAARENYWAEKRKENAEKEKAESDKRAAEAEKKREEKRKKEEEAAKEEEERLKSVNEAYANAQKEIQDINDKTEQEKLDRQKQRDKEAIDSLNATEAEKAGLYAIWNEKYFELQKELDAKLKAEAEAKEQERIDKLDDELENLGTDFEEKFAILDAQEQAIRDSAILTEQQKTEALKENAEARKAVKEAEAEHNRNITEAVAQTAMNAAKLLGEHTAAGKAMAVASATISTYLSAVDAYKGMVAAIPGPVGIAAGAVAAAASVASGLATVKKILSVKTPGGGGGGVPGGGSAPAPPQFNVVGQSGTNQIAQSISKQQGKPVEAYVVSGKVSTAQSLDRNRVNNATFN